MKLAIMQPYLFPYIGYFQLIYAVDEFIIYDNIEFTKKGWINRNRILVNGKDAYVSFPLKKGSDYLTVEERYLAENWAEERKKILNKVSECYRKAPYFDPAYSLLKEILSFEDDNLFRFIFNSLQKINRYLNINTPLVISSGIPIDHTLKAEKKVIAICKSRQASVYINPIGGVELYSKEHFLEQGIQLKFHKSEEITYKQLGNEFIPWLSIIDVMMFNSKEEIGEFLNLYTLN